MVTNNAGKIVWGKIPVGFILIRTFFSGKKSSNYEIMKRVH